MNKKNKININTINKIIFVMVIGIVIGNAGTVMAGEYNNIKTDTVCFNSTYNLKRCPPPLGSGELQSYHS